MIHYFQHCAVTASGKQLPKWGFEQQEVSCNPNLRDKNALWNVEDNYFELCKLLEKNLLFPTHSCENCFMLIAVCKTTMYATHVGEASHLWGKIYEQLCVQLSGNFSSYLEIWCNGSFFLSPNEDAECMLNYRLNVAFKLLSFEFQTVLKL